MRLTDLYEGRGATLFHGTGWHAAAQIMREDALRPNTPHTIPGQPDLLHGVSLTRNPRVARSMGDGVVFELDERRLAQRHRIIPVDYWHNKPSVERRTQRWNEAEEFVVGPIVTLSRYLVRIWIDDSRLRYLPSWIGEWLDEEMRDHPLVVFGQPTPHEIRMAMGRPV